MENINIDRIGNDLADAYEEGYKQGIKKNEEKMEKENTIYVIYDWFMDEIKKVSYDRYKALAEIGFDFLSGDDIDNYKFLEINLDEIKD